MLDVLTIERQEQFDAYYRDNGLNTVDDKIKHLMSVTGVKAIRGGSTDDSNKTLALLEESTLLGYWKDLQ